MCDDDVGHRGAPRRSPGRRRAAEDRPGCVEGTARGRRAAFEDLYDATVEDVHHLALLMSRGDVGRAQGLVRATYAEVRCRAASFKPGEHRERTWVLAIASEVGRDLGRPGGRPA